jgi:hypothetical protein
MTVMSATDFERMCAWLQGPEALNVRVDPDQPDDLDAAAWDCDGTHRFTLRWLRANEVDVDANFALIRDLGGCCCDCEVLFNVAAPARWPGQTAHRDDDQEDAAALDDAYNGNDLAHDDDALLDWLNGPEFAPPPAFMRNVRKLHFHITFQNPDQGLHQTLLKSLQRLECAITATEGETITGYLEYNPRYHRDRKATAELHKLLNRWERKGHLTWSASRKNGV